MDQVFKISVFILQSFGHIWPYLLISIPFAVGIQFSGASKYINKSLSKNPYVSIILATAIGAISPFCSCGVIPVITSLLIGGVPLAPVMSFWIASPSMDPEIFMLSVATIGWKLSVWRLVSTFTISILSGLITHFAMKNGFFGNEFLRINPVLNTKLKQKNYLRKSFDWTVIAVQNIFSQKKATVQLMGINSLDKKNTTVNCCVSYDESMLITEPTPLEPCNICNCSSSSKQLNTSFFKKLITETWKAFSMVAKFMAIAFFINALIEFYLPKDFMTQFSGVNNHISVLVAALVGIPFYTSNLTALPLVSGLLSLGMNQGAALSFLIAGPVTTLPAMMAVWGIVKPRVFLFYILFSLFGAILFGYLYNFIN